LNNKTKIKLTEQEDKSVGTSWWCWTTTRTFDLNYQA